MYKGKITIELTDQITGKKETYKQENMVTNAVAYVLGIAAQEAGNPTKGVNDFGNILPISTKALGGIFLFDGSLTEDVENVHFPMDVHLTGHAGQESNTTGTMSGSINTEESGQTDNGYVNVWDFSTSQANGTIASIALTHSKSGQDPFRYEIPESYATLSLDRSEVSLFYDEDSGDEFFYYQGMIYRKHMITTEIYVNSPTFGDEERVFDFSFSKPNYGSWSVSNGYDGYIYAVYVPATSSKGTVNVRIRKVKVSDLSFEEEDEQTIQLTNVTTYRTDSLGYTQNMNWVVSKGYLYGKSYSEDLLYKINLSNTADVEELIIDGYTFQKIFPKYNGGVFISVAKVGQNSSGASQTYVYPGLMYEDGESRIYEEDTLTSAIDTFAYTGYVSKKLFLYKNYGSSNAAILYSRNYLGTICNLSSPVVKTSAQSMKITYTLTNV